MRLTGLCHSTDAAPTGSSFQGKNSTSCTSEPTEVEAKSSDPRHTQTSLAPPQEPQPAPQPASPEVSWMSLAMEKTRSLQQLFTSKFPRDFTAVQTTLRAQAQSASPTEAQTQAVNKQPSTTPGQTATDTVKAETPSVKPAQMSKQAPEAQSVFHPAVQTSPWTPKSTPTETSCQSEQGGATQSSLPSGQHDTPQPPPWSHRGLLRTNQLKPSTSSATPPLPRFEKGEREVNVQEKEGSSLPGRRPVWGGTVSERAALLEKQAESASPPGTKGVCGTFLDLYVKYNLNCQLSGLDELTCISSQVELRKTQTEAPAPGDTPASTKSTAPSKDTRPEGREGGKPAGGWTRMNNRQSITCHFNIYTHLVTLSESSPIKVPDKWPRKNVASSSPSSSPTQSSMSESSQPSWMELAKRKSMAWNDRTMD